MMYKDFCYECVPPLVFSLARKEKVKFDNYFDALQKVDILSPELKSNIDIAKWAFNVATTRSFGPDNDKYIAPSADMVRSCVCVRVCACVCFPIILSVVLFILHCPRRSHNLIHRSVYS